MPSSTLERTKNPPQVVTWAASTTSSVVSHPGGSMFSLYLPSGFVGTSVSFLVYEEALDAYKQVYKDGSLFSVTVTADKRNIITSDYFAAGGKFKVVSGSSETGTGYWHSVN